MSENTGKLVLELASKRHSLQAGRLYLIGGGQEEQNKKVDIVLQDEELDEKHALLEVNPNGEVTILDLNSLLGIYLNGERLKAMVKTRMRHQDVLLLGKQSGKFRIEGTEESGDSSGFLDTGRNTSDIICSSPEKPPKATGKHLNIKEFPNDSLPTNSRQSCSFTIPETQFCAPHNLSNLNTLIPKDKLHTNTSRESNDDDDVCIPETQEIRTSHSEVPPLLHHNKGLVAEENILEENCEDSLFRIPTQEYNGDCGQNESAFSQIIPLILHKPQLLNASDGIPQKADVTARNPAESRLSVENSDAEMVALNSLRSDQNDTNLRDDASTPDILDFENFEANQAAQEDVSTLSAAEQPERISSKPDGELIGDEEDLLATQVFPTDGKMLRDGQNITKEIEQNKKDENFLTLSDKENILPPHKMLGLDGDGGDMSSTQLFVPNNEVVARLLDSTSHKTNSLTKSNKKQGPKETTSTITSFNDNDDEELLSTQVFFQLPQNDDRPSCFNSTLLDDKLSDGHPVNIFAEAESTTHKASPEETTLAPFKKPQSETPATKKTSSSVSVTSNATACSIAESDADLLMCTPQIIKEQIRVVHSSEIKQKLLAVRHKTLFGETTDDDNQDDCDSTEEFEFTKPTKEANDFDKLLPHLKHSNEPCKAVLLDHREHHKNDSATRSTLSRDERHLARDKERALAERRERQKAENLNRNKESSTKNTKKRRTLETKGLEVRIRRHKSPSNRSRGSTHKEEKGSEKRVEELPVKRLTRLQSKVGEVLSTSKVNEIEDKPGQSKTRKQQLDTDLDNQPTQPLPGTRRKRRKRSSILKDEASQESSAITCSHQEQTSPIGRITRSHSKESESHNISKITEMGGITGRNKVVKQQLDMDLQPTQPLPRHTTRSLSPPKELECQRSLGNELKRKASTPGQQVPVEQKRLRSASSEENVSFSRHTTSSVRLKVSATMVDPEIFQKLSLNSTGLWTIARDPIECDILVMDKGNRTFKFLLAMARGIPIVTSNWLRKVNETKSLINISEYFFNDAAFEKRHKFSLLKSLHLASRKERLFAGYDFVMTSGISPQPSEIKAIIECAGGTVHSGSLPPFKVKQNLYLISTANDKKDWHKFRRLNGNIVIISTEGVMSAVMRQNVSALQKNVLS